MMEVFSHVQISEMFAIIYFQTHPRSQHSSIFGSLAMTSSTHITMHNLRQEKADQRNPSCIIIIMSGVLLQDP